jgi:SAM-dependent methyltransferase
VNSHVDFGYPWWLSYGHLVLVAIAVPLFFLALKRNWPKILLALFGAFALWTVAAFLTARFMLNINGEPALPTAHFLASGQGGRILDMGAGTGRSTIMVLRERPQTNVVALDLFTTSYEQHFGRTAQSGQERLLSNLRATGFEQRASIQPGDMRDLPFAPEAFDGIVSAYAIDHLNREGIQRSLKEAARVLKPGGEFLLMLIYQDPWLKFSFGPLLIHSGFRSSDWWATRLREAGFEVNEYGIRPATLYLLARKPRPTA